PSLTRCTQSKTKRRTLNLKPQPLYEALQQNRRQKKTKEFQREYRQRAGIEGTISPGVRAFGLRKARYLGLAKTRLQHLATAAAMNLERLADGLAGVDRETTRRSIFTRVMRPRTASYVRQQYQNRRSMVISGTACDCRLPRDRHTYQIF